MRNGNIEQNSGDMRSSFSIFRRLIQGGDRRRLRGTATERTLSVPEAFEARELLSAISVVNSPVEAANVATSQFDRGMIGFDEATGKWQANRYNGSEFVTETLADWDPRVGTVPTAFGDLWGTGQQNAIRYEASTGRLLGDWQAGTSISSGVISGWSAGMDLGYFLARDVNGDGRVDLLGYNRTNGSWGASISAPGNKYTARTIGTWDKSADWKYVTTADFDADGLLDLAGYNPAAKTWSLLLGTTSGGFTKPNGTIGNPSRNVGQALIANFNGVAGAEILEWDSSSGEWFSTSYAGRVVQTIMVGQWRATGNWGSVGIGDFWGTGRQAILGHDNLTNEWWITWSVGAGVTTRRLTTWGAGVYGNAQFLDLNQDGRTDILARNLTTGAWYQLSSTSTGNNSTLLVGQTVGGEVYDAIQVGDFTGDGKPDVLAHRTGSGRWDVLKSRASSGFEVSSLTVDFTEYRPSESTVGDADGDGRIEVLYRDQGTNNWVKVGWNGGAWGWSAWNPWNASADQWSNATTIDFDGDGDSDLLARDPQSGVWWLTEFEGSRRVTRKVGDWTPGGNWSRVQSVDFDGNGSQDMVGWNGATGEWWWLRRENGATVSSAIGKWDATVAWLDSQIVDLFGTGMPVLMGRNGTTGYWWGVWKTPNGTSSRQLTGFNPAKSYGDPRVVDFNGDGKESLVIRETTSGTWYAVQFVGNNFRGMTLGTWSNPSNWKDLFVADLDGDGKDSLYGRNQYSGALVEIYSTGGGFAQRSVWTVLPHESLDLSVVADPWGSGRDGILMRSALTGCWFALHQSSEGNFSFQQLGVWQATQGWNEVFVGDLNRDGREDLAGYKGGQGGWTWVSREGETWQSGSTPAWSGVSSWKSLSVSDVPGVGEASLRATILEMTPGLKEAVANNNQPLIASLVRNWVANNVDYALFNEMLERDAPTLADNFLVTFAKDQAGASCGGYGFLMAATLKLFGIDALIVSFGQTAGGLTHTTTVLPIKVGGEYRFQLVDATFNTTFIDEENGTPLSYFDVLDAVFEEEFDSLAIQQGSVENRHFLSKSDRSSLPGVELLGVNGAGVYAHRWEEYGLDDYVATIEPLLALYGYSYGFEGFLELMAKILEVNSLPVSGTAGAEALAAFRSQMAARGLS